MYILKNLTDDRAKYGDIFTLYMGGQYMTFVMEPIKSIPEIYRNSKTLTFAVCFEVMTSADVMQKTLERVFETVFGASNRIATDEILAKSHNKWADVCNVTLKFH